MSHIQLGETRIGDDGPPYVIAEIGVNHEGSMDTARRLIDLAREGGADEQEHRQGLPCEACPSSKVSC